MPLRRLIPTLLALLAVVAGVGVPAATVLCETDDHVAVEFATASLHCDTPAPADHSESVSVGETGCSDTPNGVDTPARPAPSGEAVPAPLPPVLIAIVPAEVERPMFPGRVLEKDVAPPPHLLPLRSFVLLT